MSHQNFLTLLDLTPETLRGLVSRAVELKNIQKSGTLHEPLKHKILAMVFEKSSTRTRMSFEAGMAQLGGHAIFLSPRDTQLGRGETIEDSARVLSRMADVIMIRTFEHEKIERFAEYSQAPVITVTWIGDGNNMCHSYINAARQYGFTLNIACPEGYDPDAAILQAAGSSAAIIRNPLDAARNADLVVTDVWASMGQEEEQAKREQAFANYQVNTSLMQAAARDALFMHCLPAHRGEEVAAGVIDGPQSVVWDEAENRLHAQKALLEYLLR
jgi:ornithine carbamoyltransferase